MTDRYAAASQEVDHRSGRLQRVLSTLLNQAPEMEAAAVVSFDGLPMASALPHGMDEDRVAAMSAALLSLGERAAQGLGRGDLSQVYVEGEQGTVFLVSADDEAVLVAVGARGAKVGLLLFEVKQAAAAVAQTLRHEPADFAPPPAAAPPVPAEPVHSQPVHHQPEHDRAEHDRTETVRTEPARTEQVRTEPVYESFREAAPEAPRQPVAVAVSEPEPQRAAYEDRMTEPAPRYAVEPDDRGWDDERPQPPVPPRHRSPEPSAWS